MIEPLDQKKITQFMTAIGDPIRLQILFVLHGSRMNVTDIASKFKISRPAVSHHLKVLRDSEVVRSEKVGQEVYYWVNKAYIVTELRGLADSLEIFLEMDET